MTRRSGGPSGPRLLTPLGGNLDPPVKAVAALFDPARLTQARHVALLTKRSVAEALGVSAVAVGQWEAGTTSPRPDHVARLADTLGVPVGFLAGGRPYARLDGSGTHFRSLRRTPAIQRARAVAFAEQVWELAHALNTRVELPGVDLPGLSGGETVPGLAPSTPGHAARLIRQRWGLGTGPIPRLVNTMERHGLVVTLVNFAGGSRTQTAMVDAFSTSHLPRPVVVLTPDRGDDVYRHRFTAAHELGHLLLHTDTATGDPLQEREADAFAAELLTPADVITPRLPSRLDIASLERLGREWGVNIESLIYRCKEVGAVSDATYRRAFQRLNQLRQTNLYQRDPVDGHPGEQPALLRSAFALAEQHGLTRSALAAELRCTLPRLRVLLGERNDRPVLRLVT